MCELYSVPPGLHRRHANVDNTTGYYIKTAADDVREAMTKLEKGIPRAPSDTNRTPDQPSTSPN